MTILDWVEIVSQRRSALSDAPERQDVTLVGRDGRILQMSCKRFVDEIVMGDSCFVCGASPRDKAFNGEHIIPRWILRRFGLFDKQMSLPTGERRRYRGYQIPCCVSCNSLLGTKVETPISQLLRGSYQEVASRLNESALRLLFTWLALLFFKTHLKDRSVKLHKDPRIGSEVVGDAYNWADMHLLHAIVRSPYTKASLLPGVIGSLRIYEITGLPSHDGWDYLDFSHDQTIVVRVGKIGIVATLNDSRAGESVWSKRLDVIDGPITELQLREIGAMFALANRNLIDRPVFSTLVYNKTFVMIDCLLPPLRLAPFDPKAFGEVLLFAVRNYVQRKAFTVGGSRDPETVAAAIATGHVRFLTFNGEFIRPEIL